MNIFEYVADKLESYHARKTGIPKPTPVRPTRIAEYRLRDHANARISLFIKPTVQYGGVVGYAVSLRFGSRPAFGETVSVVRGEQLIEAFSFLGGQPVASAWNLEPFIREALRFNLIQQCRTVGGSEGKIVELITSTTSQRFRYPTGRK